MNYFKGIIRCDVCGGNFNGRINNGQRELICSRKKNYGKNKCNSPTIKEKDLIEIISMHLKHENKNFDLPKIKLHVKEIKINNERIKIIYRNGTFSEISGSHYII